MGTAFFDFKEVAVSSSGSVAPKERVNIVYRPATGDAQTEVELPLKLLVVGDYTLRDDDTPLDEVKPINVDKDNFNDVLKGQNLSLNLSVPNKLDAAAGEDAQLGRQARFPVDFGFFSRCDRRENPRVEPDHRPARVAQGLEGTAR